MSANIVWVRTKHCAFLFILPKSTIKVIGNIFMIFLWGQTNEYHKTPPKVCNTICLPKSVGGLGVKGCLACNKVAIEKHLWFLINDKACP